MIPTFMHDISYILPVLATREIKIAACAVPQAVDQPIIA
jgi:hypothetical protein